MTFPSLLATWFGSGLLPKAPGTWGSLAALPFAFAIHYLAGQFALLLASLTIFAIGCWASGVHAKRLGVKDPGEIVIDEVAGQWLTLAFVPVSAWAYVAGFVLFRLADIFKPWPASWLDRKVEGGLGVMADDMAAGLYAGAALWLLMEVVL
jgi:phosphatidylglycerophosphatase A